MMQSFCTASRDNKQATTVNKQFSHIFYLHECAQKAPVYIYLSQLNGDGGDWVTWLVIIDTNYFVILYYWMK